MRLSKKEKQKKLFAIRQEKRMEAAVESDSRRMVGLTKSGWTWDNNTEEHVLITPENTYKTESIYEACMIHKKINDEIADKQKNKMIQLLEDGGWTKIQQVVLIGTKRVKEEKIDIIETRVFWKKKYGDKFVIKNLKDAWSMQMKVVA